MPETVVLRLTRLIRLADPLLHPEWSDDRLVYVLSQVPSGPGSSYACIRPLAADDDFLRVCLHFVLHSVPEDEHARGDADGRAGHALPALRTAPPRHICLLPGQLIDHENSYPYERTTLLPAYVVVSHGVGITRSSISPCTPRNTFRQPTPPSRPHFLCFRICFVLLHTLYYIGTLGGMGGMAIGSTGSTPLSIDTPSPTFAPPLR